MPVYVDSNASGANDGTSWTDAYVSIASTTGVAAGTEIWVEDSHSEDFGALTSLSFSNGTRANPVRILCVDSSDDSLSTGAVIAASGGGYRIDISGNIYAYGIEWQADDDLNPGGANQRAVFDSCVFTWLSGAFSSRTMLIAGGFGSPALVEFLDCVIDFSSSAATTSGFALSWGYVRVRGGQIIVGSGDASLVDSLTRRGRLVVEDCDIQGWDELSSVVGGELTAILRRCRINSSLVCTSGSPSDVDEFRIENCDDGTITVPPLGVWQTKSYRGTVAATLSKYRIGGADDGAQANEYSFEMATNANALELYSPLEITLAKRWVSVGSQTISVYLASGTTLQNDEFWIEVSGPSEEVSATAQGKFRTTRADPLATPTNLDTDSVNTWNGTGVGTKQKIDVAINPTIAGLIEIKAFLAKPSTTIYVCPKIGLA